MKRPRWYVLRHGGWCQDMTDGAGPFPTASAAAAAADGLPRGIGPTSKRAYRGAFFAIEIDNVPPGGLTVCMGPHDTLRKAVKDRAEELESGAVYNTDDQFIGVCRYWRDEPDGTQIVIVRRLEGV